MGFLEDGAKGGGKGFGFCRVRAGDTVSAWLLLIDRDNDSIKIAPEVDTYKGGNGEAEVGEFGLDGEVIIFDQDGHFWGKRIFVS